MRDRTTVDADLEQKEGEWEFDEAVADEFDSHVRKSIPLYDHVQKMVIDLSDWFVRSGNDEIVYDLGCATGQTIENLVSYYGEKAPPNFIGVDVEEEMLKKARQNVGDYENVNLLKADITRNLSFSDATLVCGLFTLGFLREGDREEVLTQIYDDLKQGGGLIFVEKTRATSSFYEDIWMEHYWDFKRRQGLSEEAIIGKARTLRGQLRPISINEYMEMLERAGFDTDQNVDIFFKWYPWTGIVARK